MDKGNQITKVEQYAIDRVRELRKQKGISQEQLAYEIDVSKGFIGDVENPKYRAKYNINHLNAIAKALRCRIWDLLPEKPM